MSEVYADGSFVLDTPNEIAVARFLSAYHALKFEVKHPGLKLARAPMVKFCRENYGCKGRTKKQVLVEMEAIKQQLLPEGESK